MSIVAGVHVANHLIERAGVRVPLGSGFAVTAAGMVLLSGVDAAAYLADLLPGMLVAGAASASSWLPWPSPCSPARARTRPGCSPA